MPRYGIDFGGSKCCAAVPGEKGRAQLVATSGGDRLIPSVVAFGRPGLDGKVGDPALGAAARRLALGDRPRGVVAGVRRIFGRRIDDPELRRPGPWLGGGLLPSENGDAWIEVNGVPMSPPAIAAHLFAALHAAAIVHLSGPGPHEAVIAVAPGADHAARQAVKDAAELGGVRVARLLSAAAAAVLGHGQAEPRRPGRLAVCDLGSHRFDASVVTVEGGVVWVQATAGDTVGGDDFDRRLAARLAGETRAAHGVDVEADSALYGRFLDEVQKVKHQASDVGQAVMALPTPDGTAPRTVKRVEIEAWTRDLVDRIDAACREVLAAAQVKPGEIREVLLVGGGARFPAVGRKIEQVFGCPITRAANPEEVVALGAAIYGAALDGALDGVLALESSPHLVAVSAAGQASPVVPRFSTLPARGERLVTTSRDGQTQIAVDLVEGEDGGRPLARYLLSEIPEAPAGEVQLLVDVTVDGDGLVGLQARPLGGGPRPKIRREVMSGLPRAELRRRRA